MNSLRNIAVKPDYTIDLERDGQIVGMLSVNGYDGQVFPHTWHGTFIEMSEE